MMSVDPERDTQGALAKYVTAFDPRFLGLDTVDHSAQSYVIDPQGRMRLLVRHDRIAQDLGDDLKTLLRAQS
jgi:protein SCO1/2